MSHLFSHQELQAIAEVQTTVYRVNNPVGNPEPFEGYFTWSYIRDGDVIATQSGDFPDQIEIRGETDE